MENTIYWIWIQPAVGQGSSQVPRLLEHFPTPKDAYDADRAALQKAGITGRALDKLCDKSLLGAEQILKRSEKLGWIITYDDAGYPELLRHIFSPPLVLYGRGILPHFDRTTVPSIGMVGTRKCTQYGIRVAGEIAAGLAAVGCVIVSGGAKGIDRAAHEGALYAGGRTVVVQACGLDINYPKPNREMRDRVVQEGGAVISEYAPGVPGYANHYDVRNRLISGLSWGVCVVEAPQRSGALITARHTRDQNRDLFVVPGDITSPASIGSNELIKEGATLVTRAGEILREYQGCFGGTLSEDEANRAQEAYAQFKADGGVVPMKDEPLMVADNPPPLVISCPEYASDEAKQIFAALTEMPVDAEELCTATGVAVNRLFAALTELELMGCIRSYPGKRYSL